MKVCFSRSMIFTCMISREDTEEYTYHSKNLCYDSISINFGSEVSYKFYV